MTSTYSDWFLKSHECLLTSMLPGFLCTVLAEGHKISSRLWNDTVEVMADEQ